MIECKNQGAYGREFSSLTVGKCGDEASFVIHPSRGASSVSVILNKKNVSILAKKLLEWAGEKPECDIAVHGSLVGAGE